MKTIPIAGVRIKSTPVTVAEAVASSEDVPIISSILLKLGDTALSMGLADVQAFKFLLCKAERHLLLRQEQELKSRNFTLDLK